MKASKRQRRAQAAPSQPQPDAVHLRLEAFADTHREQIARTLAELAASGPPAVVLVLPPGEPPLIQPSHRTPVLAMARALGLGVSVDGLGPMSPVLVMGEGRAVLLGSAVGAAPPVPPVNGPGGAA